MSNCITLGQTYDAYKVGFSLAKEALSSNHSFGCIGYPKIFMTDNSLAEINALNHNWPSSKHLLCVFHVLQAVWRWLWETKNKIPKEKRKYIMKSFQKVLYADTINKAEEAYAAAKHSEFENWNKYLDSYWDFRFKWCLAWRNEVVRSHQTNNYSEITVRIFKDVVLSRVKAYNVIALIDFVCTVLNDYYCRRFREFANSRSSKARLFLQAQSKKANDIKPENISQLSETEYIIIMSSDETYEVNTKIGVCSCDKGKYGSFCIHQCAVYMHFDAVSVNFPPVSPTDKHTISILADGDDSLPLTFFEPLIPNIAQNKLSSNNDFDNLHDTKNDNTSKEDQLTLTEVSEVITQEPISVSMECIVTLMNNLNNKYGSSVSGLQQLETRLKKINSEGTWETFLHTAGSSSVPLRKRSGCAIKVQPTSIARRSITLTRGSKWFPVGRPANGENKTQKRKRNLGNNINKNLPNAKPHGRGH